jgi:hypothetical protein
MDAQEPVRAQRREIPMGTCDWCGKPDAQWVLESAETPGLCRECAARVKGERTRKLQLQIGSGAAVALLIAVVWISTFVAQRNLERSPKPSLRSLGQAIQTGDRTSLARYFDQTTIERDFKDAIDRVRNGGQREVDSSLGAWYASTFPRMFAGDPTSMTVAGTTATVAYDVPASCGAPAARVVLACTAQHDQKGDFWRVTRLGNPDEIVAMFSRPVIHSSSSGSGSWSLPPANGYVPQTGSGSNNSYPGYAYPNSGSSGYGSTGSSSSAYGGSGYSQPSKPANTTRVQPPQPGYAPPKSKPATSFITP